MTPEERKQFEDLQKKVEDLQWIRNIDFLENLENKRVKRLTDVDDTDVEREVTVSIGTGSTTIQVLDYPDLWKIIEYKGTLYRIPLYLESRF